MAEIETETDFGAWPFPPPSALMHMQSEIVG